MGTGVVGNAEISALIVHSCSHAVALRLGGAGLSVVPRSSCLPESSPRLSAPARPCGRGRLAQFSLPQRLAVWWLATMADPPIAGGAFSPVSSRCSFCDPPLFNTSVSGCAMRNRPRIFPVQPDRGRNSSAPCRTESWHQPVFRTPDGDQNCRLSWYSYHSRQSYTGPYVFRPHDMERPGLEGRFLRENRR